MDAPPPGIRGRLFEIQRACFHDGPGLRTTVFLKGCPLRCRWCHNPEGQRPERELSFVAERCIGCRYCFSVCPAGAHQVGGTVRRQSTPVTSTVCGQWHHVLDRARCTRCGKCIEQCYAGALEVVGRDLTVDETLAEVLKDRPFYATSGGGLTLSGGEPLMQPDFSLALLRRAKAAGLHCAVETCGFGDRARFDEMRPWVDLFLFDLKETDPARHVESTGVPLEPILANLRALHDAGAPVLLRLPVVPGFNDRPDHFAAVAALARTLPRLLGVEVLAYHRLGLGKAKRLGLEDERMVDRPAPEAAQVAAWVSALRSLGTTVKNETLASSPP